MSAGLNLKPMFRGNWFMKIETTIFQLYRRRYKNISELARAMGISVGQVYRVRQGKRSCLVVIRP